MSKTDSQKNKAPKLLQPGAIPKKSLDATDKDVNEITTSSKTGKDKKRKAEPPVIDEKSNKDEINIKCKKNKVSKTEKKDRKSKADKKDKHGKSEKKDKESKPEKKDKESKTDKKEKKSKTDKKDKESKAEKKDKPSKPEKKDKESKSEKVKTTTTEPSTQTIQPKNLKNTGTNLDVANDNNQLQKGGWNDWNGTNLGSQDRTNKFLRLMGAKKKSTDTSGPQVDGVKTGLAQPNFGKINQDLEQQFHQGINARKSGKSGKNVGLGF
ncbi:hypothetical protein BB561_001127 [Smittium simulii]|uniref:Small acidic protein n=1 Tax=Smittium simulii TaxID=133385 RepID=A0A2T9YW09_9FUNG|nr:hypothetical protein BB561_001127 [Smittium simulii]